MPDKFSIVILTLNEEKSLPLCLQSIRGCEDVLVLDSGSSDATQKVARDHGARVMENPFKNFAQQRNFANRCGGLRNLWVFHLDADELFTPELMAECRNYHPAIDIDGAWVAPQMFWKGNWMKHCTDYPAWQARFVNREKFEFIEVGHGQRESSQMRMDRLKSAYQHDMSRNGVDEWLSKHQRYARAEAKAFLSESPLPFRNLWHSDPLLRRRTAKRLSYHLPCRAALRFVYQYFLRGGILDGKGAFEYCRLLSRYEKFATQAIRDLRKREAYRND